MREFVETTVILAPGVGNPGSVLDPVVAFPANPANPVQNSERLILTVKNHGLEHTLPEKDFHFWGLSS